MASRVVRGRAPIEAGERRRVIGAPFRPRNVVPFVALLVMGCAGPRTGGDSQTLRASATPYEVDIPLPTGFRLVDQSSEDWSGGRLRYLRHRYVGRADKYAVRRFYRDQMPLARWTPRGNGNVGGRVVMWFEREAESCTITIEDDRSSLSRRVSVEVIVTPSVSEKGSTRTRIKRRS